MFAINDPDPWRSLAFDYDQMRHFFFNDQIRGLVLGSPVKRWEWKSGKMSEFDGGDWKLEFFFFFFIKIEPSIRDFYQEDTICEYPIHFQSPGPLIPGPQVHVGIT